MDAMPYLPAPVKTPAHLSSLDGFILQRGQYGILGTVDKTTLAADGQAEHPNKDMAVLSTFHRENAVMLISPTWLMRRLGHL